MHSPHATLTQTNVQTNFFGIFHILFPIRRPRRRDGGSNWIYSHVAHCVVRMGHRETQVTAIHLLVRQFVCVCGLLTHICTAQPFLCVLFICYVFFSVFGQSKISANFVVCLWLRQNCGCRRHLISSFAFAAIIHIHTKCVADVVRRQTHYIFDLYWF